MYNYYFAMKSDILDYLMDNADFTASELLDRDGREEIAERLHDELWIEDSVTGNASGSYTFNRWTAREYVLDNMDELRDALEEFGCAPEYVGEKILAEDWETLDVVIRCKLLSGVLSEVLDDITDALAGIMNDAAEVAAKLAA